MSLYRPKTVLLQVLKSQRLKTRTLFPELEGGMASGSGPVKDPNDVLPLTWST